MGIEKKRWTEHLKVKNWGVKKTMVILTLFIMCVVIGLILLEHSLLEKWYMAELHPYLIEYQIAPGFMTTIRKSVPNEVNGKLGQIAVLEVISMLVTIGGGILLNAYLVYLLKLKKPLKLLDEASKRISEQDLDFVVEYESEDELGRLCGTFEKMRASLEENNRSLWRSVEERKRLNAAFSHDLRTPLTVLRGYGEYILKYYGEDRLPKDKVLKTVTTMNENIKRLEEYVRSMNSMQKLEDIPVDRKPVPMEPLIHELTEQAGLLAEPIRIESRMTLEPDTDVCVDRQLVSQVFENLVSNALRYAKSEIVVTWTVQRGYLTILVEDDGPGFSPEGLRKAAEPYYREERGGDLHFGLGLSICRLICEKHGGCLTLKNTSDKGAAVTAVFKVDEW